VLLNKAELLDDVNKKIEKVERALRKVVEKKEVYPITYVNINKQQN
jgi:Ni2+-binding GTPase involved in maturation of urease and hydrogenase